MQKKHPQTTACRRPTGGRHLTAASACGERPVHHRFINGSKHFTEEQTSDVNGSYPEQGFASTIMDCRDGLHLAQELLIEMKGFSIFKTLCSDTNKNGLEAFGRSKLSVALRPPQRSVFPF